MYSTEYSAWLRVSAQKMQFLSPLSDIHEEHSADILAVAIMALSSPLPPSFSSYLGSREQAQPAYSAQDGLGGKTT